MSNVATEQLVVEFKPLKQEVRRTLEQLQSAQQTAQVQDAIALLEQVIEDLNDRCQPSMVIPITPR
jgi:hypothetical protein